MFRRFAPFLALLVLGAVPVVTGAGAASASAGPVITGLSAHHGAYWGGSTLTVRGSGFTQVQEVRFGPTWAPVLAVQSPSSLTVRVPWHDYATVDVRVVTAAGTSHRTRADRFRFARPSLSSPIMGGWTARQEQRISALVRSKHKGVPLASGRHGWTPAVGLTALRRAQSWLGLPYSWAGGSRSGPTRGTCTHNGGDLDCHVVGFDCSGLMLYAWSPYRQLAHYAQTQKGQAGRFHPAIAQLVPGDLVFFSAYLPNGIGHVAIYAGHGMVIQAPESGRPVVRSRLTDVIASSGTYRGATRPLTRGRQGAGPARLTADAVPLSGGLLTIRGSNLASATAVSVGGALTYSFVARSAHRLVVRVPAHRAGRAAVAVSNPWGTARATVTYLAAPDVTRIAPNTGPTGGGTVVTITGRHLAAVTAGSLDGRPLPVTVLSDTRATVTVPAHPAGAVRLLLHSPAGDAEAVTYTYADPASPSPAPSGS